MIQNCFIEEHIALCSLMNASPRPVAVVTGATGTFGFHIALGLLQAGYDTVCIGRSEEKGAELLAQLDSEIRKVGTSSRTVPDMQRLVGVPTFHAVDCSRYSSIHKFAASWAEKSSPPPAINVLINNAAIVPSDRQETADGIELQWACNVLGYDWMTRALLPFLKLAKQPRIVNVASHYAGDLDLANVEFKSTRRYDSNTAYRQSKQANRMMTKYWSDRLASGNGTLQSAVVASCHPGVANSAVLKGLGFHGDASGQRGSETPLFCALAPGVTSGCFYADKKKQTCSFSSDATQVAKLGELLESYATAQLKRARSE